MSKLIRMMILTRLAPPILGSCVYVQIGTNRTDRVERKTSSVACINAIKL